MPYKQSCIYKPIYDIQHDSFMLGVNGNAVYMYIKARSRRQAYTAHKYVSRIAAPSTYVDNSTPCI